MFSLLRLSADKPVADPIDEDKDLPSIRREVHQHLIKAIESDGTFSLQALQQLLDGAFDEIETRQHRGFSEVVRQRISKEILDEIQGLGPIAVLMSDPDISDILVNAHNEIWVDKNGRLEKSPIRFDDDIHVVRVLGRLVSSLGKHLDTASPTIDATLEDGSRLHAVIPPLSVKGPVISIRRFRAKPILAKELILQGCLSRKMLDLLALAVKSRLNIVVAGGAGAGKTTLLNVLSSYIPHDERIITAEETAELNFNHPHVVSLQTRVANTEGKGDITLRDLVHNALRMRADRIVIGEVRGEEVLDMLQAMNIGHNGSLTTVHASSAEEVQRRLETLALLNGRQVPHKAIREMIHTAVDLVVHIARVGGGQRVITSILELVTENGETRSRELFRFKPGDHKQDSSVPGEHIAVSPPNFVKRLLMADS